MNGWKNAVGDIKAAFLNAPIPETPNQKLIVRKPPTLLVRAGLVSPDERWIVRKGLYGLRRSPRWWGTHRDSTLRQVKLKVGSQDVWLKQSQADPNMWLVFAGKPCPQSCGPQGRAGHEETLLHDGTPCGVLLCYVDDILLTGPDLLVDALKEHISSLWTMGRWDDVVPGGSAVSYLGMSIKKDIDGTITLSQEDYVKSVCEKYEVTETLPTPTHGWTEPSDEESPELQDVRAAQKVLGALNWLVCRTRPDIAFAVQRLSSCALKAPKAVLKGCNVVLAYLLGTADLGLSYSATTETWGVEGQFPFPQSLDGLRIETDASHAPCGSRSQQCMLAFWHGSVVAWECSRQALTALSSAEAELIACLAGVQIGESVLPILVDLRQSEVQPCLVSDNAAAISLVNNEGGAWRTRHLKMRAQAARERRETGAWLFAHVAGRHNAADIGTKVLAAPRFRELISLLGMLPATCQMSVKAVSVQEVEQSQKASYDVRGFTPTEPFLKAVKYFEIIKTGMQGDAEQDEPSRSRGDPWMLALILVVVVMMWELVKFASQKAVVKVKKLVRALVAEPMKRCSR